MVRWGDVERAQPDLARRVRGRFEAHGLALMATLRADCGPRLCGVEPLFWDGDVWLGMMPGSRKAADLMRDPRLALHSATIDKNVADGDARVTGRGISADDAATFRRYHDAFGEANGAVPPGPFPLFRVDVTEMMFLRPAGDHLDIEVWRAGSDAYERIERR